jgi:hypothetical protein
MFPADSGVEVCAGADAVWEKGFEGMVQEQY